MRSTAVRARRASRQEAALPEQPLWYKDAIIYEVHVRAFHDSNGDGVGDFPGLTRKLDYLHDLGVTAIWLLPFYPSPLKDDGYDIADYTDVHAAYGTLADVRRFIRQAHRRGIRVITELVCNHTSDQHPWFQRARRAKAGSPWRDYYVWSDAPEKYAEARIIFKDFEPSNWTWDPVAHAYYWHRFYAHQPDLNYDHPPVAEAIMRVMEFWLEMGVDGLRLDAVPYLYERQGTNCENLPETHAFLKALRAHVDKRFKDRMLLAEANQWPEDAVSYFGDGDECHLAFHFPLMPRMFMAIRMEDRFPIIDIMQQTPAIPPTCQWALFLRNHDELTLEMVTDEERDYMYRVYAKDVEMRVNFGIRRRLAPLLGNHRRRIELMNGLLFSLPGTPVIYYGDEIGMGDNIFLGDRNAVRTPMQWTADRNAGFSATNPQRLYLPVTVDPEYHYQAVNVETQHNNPHSLLWWMKRLIALRKRSHALGWGSLEFIHPENRKVLVFTRRSGEEIVLVVANLSRFVQAAELDLSAFRGMVPVEMFGRVEFPPIGELPYFITLGPHAFYWFSLEASRADGAHPRADRPAEALPALHLRGAATDVFEPVPRGPLGELLVGYLQGKRWFGGKARRIKAARIAEVIGVPFDGDPTVMALVHVDYVEGDPDTYMLPLAVAGGERQVRLGQDAPQALIARVHPARGNGEAIVYEPLADRGFCRMLLQQIGGRRRLRGERGELVAWTTRAFRRLLDGEETLEPTTMRAEQSNSSIVYGDRLVLKLFRRLEGGINPEVEIGRFLTERDFPHIPAFVGGIDYRPARGETLSVAVLQAFVPNMGDAWRYTLDALSQYYDHAQAMPPPVEEASGSTRALLDASRLEPPALAHEMIETYLESSRLLGQRTAEMHLALASDRLDPNFAPEPFTQLYQRSIYQSMRTLLGRIIPVLRRHLADLPESVRQDASAVVEREQEIAARFRALLELKVTAMRIRVHGDYHLGQVLYTGKDFVIIDFEGEPARPLTERRLKRLSLRDVAGMIRSFHYAAYTALARLEARGIGPDAIPALEPWARSWYHWVSAVFLRAYFDAAGPSPIVPKSPEELRVLLDALLLEKAVYELGYELNNRPPWVAIPLRGILQLVRV